METEIKKKNQEECEGETAAGYPTSGKRERERGSEGEEGQGRGEKRRTGRGYEKREGKDEEKGRRGTGKKRKENK